MHRQWGLRGDFRWKAKVSLTNSGRNVGIGEISPPGEILFSLASGRFEVTVRFVAPLADFDSRICFHVFLAVASQIGNGAGCKIYVIAHDSSPPRRLKKFRESAFPCLIGSQCCDERRSVERLNWADVPRWAVILVTSSRVWM
jgi:hypothetical protein